MKIELSPTERTVLQVLIKEWEDNGCRIPVNLSYSEVYNTFEALGLTSDLKRRLEEFVSNFNLKSKNFRPKQLQTSGLKIEPQDYQPVRPPVKLGCMDREEGAPCVMQADPYGHVSCKFCGKDYTFSYPGQTTQGWSEPADIPEQGSIRGREPTRSELIDFIKGNKESKNG